MADDTGPEKLTDIEIIGLDGRVLKHLPDPVPDAEGRFSFPVDVVDPLEVKEMVLTFEGGRKLHLPNPEIAP